ncbi:putative transporter ESBP6 like protein [Verticillium longisporum]|uniref:Putative transporter ESBP6 like protein n=1 Tax=Verticillium longisporum TaxID=100787 RepID=A0A8I3AG60_VERLO|nr:putative transporter ESBP6 like protein [Verticillium longisporum]
MTTNNGTTVDLQRGEAFEMQTDDEAVEHLTNVTSIEPAPPNGGYAWVCTLCVFLVNSHTWGINSSWAVIMAHYSNESTDLKASHFEYAIIGGLSISQALLCSPVATQCHKHLGMRATMLIGSFIIFVSLLSSSFVTKTASACAGRTVSSPSAPSLPTSLRASSSARRAARRTASRVARRDELRFNPRDFGRVEVLLVMVWGIATELGYIVLLYSLPSYAASVGMTPTQGSVANALLNLGLGLGRPLVGYFSDTVGRIDMAMFMTALCAVFCFALWIPAQGFALLGVFAVLAGATLSA